MPRILKAGLVALVTVAVAVLGPGVAFAGAAAPAADPSPSATQYGCLADESGYGGDLPCELKVKVLEPICDNDVPKLRYAVEAIGSPNKTVTITWINPDGADVVQKGLPLSGTVLWPGAVEKNGVGVDWPGWRLVDGTWVEGDEFDWVRPSVKVLFEVNPHMTTTVAYPPSSPKCLTSPPDTEVLANPPGDTPPQVLSSTGSNAMPIVWGAGALVVAGAVALVLARRRHDAS
ncbi:LPXTG cell wall anchor domain-containing protein [Cellulomonas sp. HZM]|uniref:LPXTG cell wall anchor domain-containing protein n=1 Tax=Cellulomonas sp. HZM TaxID=1454010 RepID=UPI00049367B1|nr:LPXTG cell wall anchor domain-containing protein [Cellulomonas sp. HZM]